MKFETGWQWGSEPPPNRWKWQLCGTAQNEEGIDLGGNVFFHVYDAPSWFHRLMQRWLLGIRWERIKK